MKPFRDLHKPQTKFYWDHHLDTLFHNSKDHIIHIIAAVKDGIKTFNPKKETCLQTDWSGDSIGYILLWKNCDCREKQIPTCCLDG